MAIQGLCLKKGKKIDDRKVIEFCVKQNFKKNCIHLRFIAERRKYGKAHA